MNPLDALLQRAPANPMEEMGEGEMPMMPGMMGGMPPPPEPSVPVSVLLRAIMDAVGPNGGLP